ncbi:MAG: ABC transporter ATP-binding protein [Rhodoferax sp.]|nr:ABC transporter ATP-binding protein [Rhodoferax sp.]
MAYGQRTVLRDVTFEAHPGRVLAVLGANGCGKSTLLRGLAGLAPYEGVLTLEGMQGQSDLAYMPQDHSAPMGLTVMEVVLLGRLQQLGLRVTPEDLNATADALSVLGVADLAQRQLGELSGGQRQLVFLAQALVAQPRTLLLDEPTSALDIRHQLEVLQCVRELTRSRQLITLVVMHDLNAALRYCDDAVLLHNGTILATGSPDLALRPEHCAIAYGVQSERLYGNDGVPVIVPLGVARLLPEGHPGLSGADAARC